ncbi:cytochrome o ubiquinol oxidase subunit IV [Sphingomonas jaspsi]|uniref:cytochrome o ubiquinol oxidase subunit IV n=1 Tax=Sphingomonas jaspsi TaxID=392409 RepID=UPI0004B75EF2|nr:cytochrome o ubiquinol oxidase subunit IV [Sphingomonas jaspsi]
MSSHHHDEAPRLAPEYIAEARKDYTIGLIASVVLTAIPFGLVMGGASGSLGVVLTIVFAALVQIVVHIRFFLHVTARAQGGWSLITTVFTIVILAIMIAGSVWIMYHLNANMMPGMGTGGEAPPL